MKSNQQSPSILRDLGNGLVIRRTRAADAARLADFNMHIHLTDDTRQPDPLVGVWTRDLLSGKHPTFHPDDFVIVEEQETGRIISATCLIDQTWTYGGIPFRVGRPELVGTLPEFRRRGLVRQIFEIIHAQSRERGQVMQGITGIPWYYRQFGYEMALALGGGRLCYAPQNIPTLAKGTKEPYRVRAAVEQDLPFVAQTYAEGGQRWLLQDVHDEALWRYDLLTRSRKNVFALQIWIIEKEDGERVGFFANRDQLYTTEMILDHYELLSGHSYGAVTPTVLRFIQRLGERRATREGKVFNTINVNLGAEHPVYHALPEAMPKERRPYAWYIRIPDLAGFIRLIGPVLERRLAASPFAGYTGELKLSFYRRGLKLTFRDGCLLSSEPWAPEKIEDGDALFPELTFLMILLGYRSMLDVREIYADVMADGDRVRELIDALFPKQPSRVWGIG